MQYNDQSKRGNDLQITMEGRKSTNLKTEQNEPLLIIYGGDIVWFEIVNKSLPLVTPVVLNLLNIGRPTDNLMHTHTHVSNKSCKYVYVSCWLIVSVDLWVTYVRLMSLAFTLEVCSVFGNAVISLTYHMHLEAVTKNNDKKIKENNSINIT